MKINSYVNSPCNDYNLCGVGDRSFLNQKHLFFNPHTYDLCNALRLCEVGDVEKLFDLLYPHTFIFGGVR
jgi:hypothetical protein